MPKYDQYICFAIHDKSALAAIQRISNHVRDAVSAGWSGLYLLPDEDFLSVMGVRPPDKKAVESAKEKRRKQYERLKKEFEGD